MTTLTHTLPATPDRAVREAVEPGAVFTVVAWRDPVIDELPGAMATASDDLWLWWLPTVGAIGCAVAHRFASYAAEGPSSWPLADIAGTFGIGVSMSRVGHTFDRLARFGIIRRHGATIAVRLWLPPLTARQRAQLPAYLAAAYDAR